MMRFLLRSERKFHNLRDLVKKKKMEVAVTKRTRSYNWHREFDRALR